MSDPVRKPRMDLFGASFLVAFSALLGLNQVLVKLVNAGLSPSFQAGLRSLCAFGVVLSFAVITRKRLSLTDGSFWPGILSGCFFAGEFLLLFTALDYTTVARASVFFYTMPFWVAIAAHFLIAGEQITRLRGLGLILAFIGVALAVLVRPDTAGSADDARWALLGDLGCLVAATMWAGIALLARKSGISKASPEMQMLYQLAVSAPILLGFAFLGYAFFDGELLREPTGAIWSIFAFQVIGIVGIGFLAWFWLLKIYPTSDVAVFSFLAPVFGVLFGLLILGERVSWVVWQALILVAIGIVLVNWRPKNAKLN